MWLHGEFVLGATRACYPDRKLQSRAGGSVTSDSKSTHGPGSPESGLYAWAVEWLNRLWRRRLAVALTGTACIAIAVLYLLLAPKKYATEVQILPTLDNPSSNQLLSRISSLAGIENFSQKSGNGPLYPEIARSRAVLLSALDSTHDGRTFRKWFTEQDTLDYVETERLIRDLGKRIDGYVNPVTGIIVLDFETTERQLAAPFLNTVLDELDGFLREQLAGGAIDRKSSLEVRLEQVDAALRDSEAHLEDFLLANRTVAQSPILQTRLGQLQRDVQINSTMYVELKSRLEIAKIEAIGSTRSFSVLSRAVPPLIPTSPRPALTVALALMLGAGLSVLIVLLSDERERQHAANRAGTIEPRN